MGWLSGVLSGYSDQQAQIRQENAQKAELANQREAAIYKELLNSPDPYIRTSAGVGLLQSAQPRRGKSGFGGWMGEMEGNPMFPVLMNYMTTPQHTETAAVPGQPAQQFASPAPASARQLTDETQPNLAQPATSPTQGGPMANPQASPAAQVTTPPPAPPGALTDETGGTSPAPGVAAAPATAPGVATAGVTPPPAPPASMRPPGHTAAGYEYPHAFPTAEETASTAALAKQKADIQADAWMYQQAHPDWTPQQAFEAAAKLAEAHAHGAGGVSTTYIKGDVIPDKNSPTGFSRQVWLRSDPTKVQYLPAEPSNTPEYVFQKEVARRIGTIASTPEEAWAWAEKMYPKGSAEEKATFAQAYWEDSKQRMAAEARGIPSYGQVKPGAPGAAPGVTTAGAPPTPPGAASPAADTLPGAGAAVTPTTAPTTAPNFSAAIPPGFKDVSTRTGAPLSSAVQQAVNEARATKDLVNRALETLKPYKDFNNEEDGLELAMRYKKGLLDANGAAAQIANLAALQASASKALGAGGSRAYQFVVDKQQHTPRLPSDEQLAKYEIATRMLGMEPREAAKWVSLYFRNKDKPVWDSPQIMIEKLETVRRNLDDYVKESLNIDEPEPGPGAANRTPAANRAVTPPPPPPGAATAAAAPATGATGGRQDINSDIVWDANGKGTIVSGKK